MAENIVYGYDSPEDIIERMIVDDGVANRGHRRAIFNPAATIVGIACAPHAAQKHMCVIVFAGAVVSPPLHPHHQQQQHPSCG